MVYIICENCKQKIWDPRGITKKKLCRKCSMDRANRAKREKRNEKTRN